MLTTKQKILCLFALCTNIVASVFAVPATPYPVVRTLPNGSKQEVYLYGDEHFHYLTTLSGKRIVNTVVGDSTLLANGHLHQNAPSRYMRNAYVPATGTIHIPVVLVNFTDVRFTLPDPQQQFYQFFNTTGGSNPNATGSVRDYYVASSDSTLDLVFDVFGPYDLSNTMAYYGGNISTSSMKNADKLVVEAANLASQNGIDFAKYDNDRDGNIDNLSIVVAGYNEAEGGPEDAIWPHYSEVYSSTTFSGKRVKGYLMISEYRSSGGQVQAGIGTYCHEFGHALGLPDLYDTQNGSRYTVGTWDIMASGSYNNNGSTPPTYSAFERFAMGWLVPQQLQNNNNYLLPSLERTNKAYLIADTTHNMLPLSPDPIEYFLIENRQRDGWDANKDALVGTGLLVSHITFSNSAWNFNTFNNGSVLGYAIESAMFASQTYSSPADVFPGTGNVRMWKPMQNNGTQLVEQTISNIIQLADGTISFRYGMQTDKGLFFEPQTIDVLETTFDNQPVLYDTAHIMLSVKNVTTDSISLYVSNSNFSFSTDGGRTWSEGTKSDTLRVVRDSVYDIEVVVCYMPRRQNCAAQTAYLFVESNDQQFVNQIQLQGKAPRPTYITTPIITEEQDVSSSSFTILWEEQDDAEFYYVTLYSLSPNPSVDIQSFENFTSIEKIEQENWRANFTETTTLVSKSGRALYFTKSGQQIVSKEYAVSPDKIHFWLSNLYVSVDSEKVEGELTIEATAQGGKWDTIAVVHVLRTTKNLEKEYVLPVDSNYVRFRLTYNHIAGGGGMVLDDFTAYLPQTVNYIYQGTDYELYAPADRVIFSGLTANTMYYCQVQAYEDKGCEEHFSYWSAPYNVTTLPALTGDLILNIQRDDNGVYTAILPEPADGTSFLYIYNAMGQLVDVQSIPYGTTQFIISTENMTASNLYLLKLFKDRMTRKSAKGKIIYY